MKNLITALIHIAKVAKKGSKVHIIYNNKNFCHKATEITCTLPYIHYLTRTTNNWPSWLTWATLTARKNIVYTFEYQKQTYNTPNIPTYLNDPVEHRTRRFIRHIQNAANIAQWCSQIRVQIWDQIREDADWSTFYAYINYKDPVKYSNPTCMRCTEAIETCYHILTCPENTTSLRHLLTNVIAKILKKHQTYSEAKTTQITRILTNNISISDPQNPTINRVTLGILPSLATKEINRIAAVKGKIQTYIPQLILHHIAKEIHEKIWKPRCEYKYTNNTRSEQEDDNREIPIKQSTAQMISQNHHPQTSENNKLLKIDKWSRLFTIYNTSPQYINHFID
ncbi:hypothetical protein C2G38_2105599 [Gigaspora rosea]|uniref:Uncharacterized protein n=1 Tax=Gigaspora rosea TaxID=44941 RepID=A0A397UT02_9GLOM|nr:hypothetical protein C2G38_2105599 [Gigaspora rosea]